MLITAMTIENFKGIKKPTKIEFKPITLLFGANSSGKSTIIQALHYAREILERGNIDPDSTMLGGDSLDLGGFSNLVHNKDLELPISLRFDFNVETLDLSDFLPKSVDFFDATYGFEYNVNSILNPIKTGWIKIGIKWDKMKASPAIDRFEIGISGKVFCCFRPDEVTSKVKLFLFDSPLLQSIEAENNFQLFERQGFPDEKKMSAEEIEIALLEDEQEGYESFEYIPPQEDIEEDWGDSIDDVESDFYSDDYPPEEQNDSEDLEEYNDEKDCAKWRDKGCKQGSLPPVEAYQKDIERQTDITEFSKIDMSEPADQAREEILLEKISISSILKGLPFIIKRKAEESEEKDLFPGLMVSALVSIFVSFVKEALSKACYVGPLRELPARNFEPAKSPNDTRWSKGLAAWDVMQNSEPTFLKKINKWLGSTDHLNSGYTVALKEYRELRLDSPINEAISKGKLLYLDQVDIDSFMSLPVKKKLTLRDERNGIEVLPVEVGIGISQIVPVIVSAVFMKSGIVIIEQPELHIHPAFQVALGDLFIAESKGKDIAFLLETHSEHLMLRLLRRIRETTEDSLPQGRWPLKPEDIAVYYVETSSNGASISRLNIDDEGEFEDEWPKGFFDEREEELLY
jgi:hypothetical protein